MDPFMSSDIPSTDSNTSQYRLTLRQQIKLLI